MTYLVILDNVVQGLFGPAITVDHPPAGTVFPPDAHQFRDPQHAAWRAAELPGAVVQELVR